ncbi:MAG: hypothetical protein ACI4QM_01935 [Alphaproteobacteria bacterium]
MTSIFTAKTNFTAGELSHDLLGRVDLKAYDNGAFELKNVFIEPTGGVKRRPGLKHIDQLAKTGRLICLEYSANEPYIVLLQDEEVKIYHEDTCIATLPSPYTEAQLKTLRWCQSEDTLLLTHPDIPPKRLEKVNDTWQLSDFTFLVEDECILAPYHKFCDAAVTVKSSAITGSVTLTTSADFFEERHINTLLKIADGYALITAVTSATVAQATIKKKLVTDGDNTAALEPTRSFYEPAFSEQFGWPVCVAFYQSRLIFGGSKKLPNTLWFSQSADITNFELGEGYDSHAIEFTMMSDQSNAICALYAGRHLQIFTTSAEWMVSGDPLTPTNIQLRRQTQVGSPYERFVPPIGVDGATIFPAANGHEIREFLFADIEQAYQATDLSILASHLIDNPQDQTYDKHNRLAYIVMQNGHLAVLCSLRAEDLQSWTEIITKGNFISVCMAGPRAYFVIEREGVYSLECFDETYQMDNAFIQTSDATTDVFYVPDYLRDKQIKVMADGIVLPDETIHSDTLQLSTEASYVEMGLGYQHIISPLPPSVGASNAMAPVSACRLVKAVFRVIDTNTLEIDTGSGIHQEMPYALGSYQLNSNVTKKTADIVVRALGWHRSPDMPLWRIISEMPKPFKIISVTQDLKIGV